MADSASEIMALKERIAELEEVVILLAGERPRLFLGKILTPKERELWFDSVMHTREKQGFERGGIDAIQFVSAKIEMDMKRDRQNWIDLTFSSWKEKHEMYFGRNVFDSPQVLGSEIRDK